VVERTASAGLANATKPVDAAPTEPQAAGTGEEVRDGDFAFVVNGVPTTGVIADAEFPELNKTAEGEYIIVDLTVTNVSAEHGGRSRSWCVDRDRSGLRRAKGHGPRVDLASRRAIVRRCCGRSVSSGLVPETARMYPL
jgi:hypothetical protein